MKVQVKFLRALYPYSKNQVADMRKDTAEMWSKQWAVEILDKIPSKKNKSMQGRKEVENKSEDEAIEELQKQYEEVYGKPAPNAYKNKPWRLINKIENK